jgi:prepilin-type N-terminal cleavage/methylation domain-containing protein
MRRSAVTLIELLVVLTIVGILLALLFPAVQVARERARDATCKNNLHQLNLALVRYAEVNHSLPPRVAGDTIGGWTIDVLPYLEQENLHTSIAPGTKIAAAPASLLQSPPIMRCPVRSTLDKSASQSMQPAHYILAADSGRDSFSLFDAPVETVLPWASGPELPYKLLRDAVGPHRGGKFYARGAQQGIEFLPGDRP